MYQRKPVYFDVPLFFPLFSAGYWIIPLGSKSSKFHLVVTVAAARLQQAFCGCDGQFTGFGISVIVWSQRQNASPPLFLYQFVILSCLLL